MQLNICNYLWIKWISLKLTKILLFQCFNFLIAKISIVCLNELMKNYFSFSVLKTTTPLLFSCLISEKNWRYGIEKAVWRVLRKWARQFFVSRSTVTLNVVLKTIVHTTSSIQYILIHKKIFFRTKGTFSTLYLHFISFI